MSDKPIRIYIGMYTSPEIKDALGKQLPRYGAAVYLNGSYIPLKDSDLGEVGENKETRFWTPKDAMQFAKWIASRLRLRFDPRQFGKERVYSTIMDPLTLSIEEVNEQGYQVNNLYQGMDKNWRCSLRRPKTQEELTDGERDEDFYEWGQGPTPLDAVENAAHNASMMFSKSYQTARKKVRR